MTHLLVIFRLCCGKQPHQGTLGTDIWAGRNHLPTVQRAGAWRGLGGGARGAHHDPESSLRATYHVTIETAQKARHTDTPLASAFSHLLPAALRPVLGSPLSKVQLPEQVGVLMPIPCGEAGFPEPAGRSVGLWLCCSRPSEKGHSGSGGNRSAPHWESESTSNTCFHGQQSVARRASCPRPVRSL